MSFKYYLASLWIANLGVVPLFSLAFFLFAPAFFLFNFLLILVCVVFEDISKSLSYLINCNYREVFLSRNQLFVKTFFIATLCTVTFETSAKDIFISKGEQIELSTYNLSSFSVGNKEVLKYKYLKSKKKIFIKGKSIGFSDLIIWKKGKGKEKYNFYVTSKRDQLEKMKLGQTLENSGLATTIKGDIIQVSGEVKDFKTYSLLKKIMNKKNKDLILQVNLSPKLRNKIIEKIYLELEKQGALTYSCENFKISIQCFYKGDLKNSKSGEYLRQTYFVELSNESLAQLDSNLELKFNIMSTETTAGNYLDSGFKQISGSLNDLIQTGHTELNSTSFFLQDTNTKVDLLASPNVVVTKDSPFKLEVGKEIAIPKKDQENLSYIWKFIGLKISGNLLIKNNKLKLKYSYKYTQGNKDNINGPRGSSEVFIEPGKSINLFNIILSQISDESKGVPSLKEVPFFGGLFQESFNNSLKQNINIFVTLNKPNGEK